MTSQHGSSDFRSRISKGARESGRAHSLKRAAGGPIDSFKTGGRVKHLYQGGFGGFMKDFGDGFQQGFGGTMKLLGPLLPMLLKKGGHVPKKAAGGVGKIRHGQMKGPK